jgi:hypothetical protein
MSTGAAEGFDLIEIGLAVGFWVLFILYFRQVFRDAANSIREWSERENVQIIEKELRLWRTGPFWCSGNRPVYKILVATTEGQKRTCWIRCNSLFGFNTKAIEVRWDERSA